MGSEMCIRDRCGLHTVDSAPPHFFCLDLNSKKRSPRAGAEKPLSGPGGNSGREKEKKTAVRGLPRGGGRTSAGRRPGKRPERGPGAGPASIPQWASLLSLNPKVNIIGHPPLTIRNGTYLGSIKQ